MQRVYRVVVEKSDEAFQVSYPPASWPVDCVRVRDFVPAAGIPRLPKPAELANYCDRWGVCVGVDSFGDKFFGWAAGSRAGYTEREWELREFGSYEVMPTVRQRCEAAAHGTADHMDE